MTLLIKTLAAVAAGTVLATSALAQSAQIEHHVAKIDGVRFHYVTAGTGDPVLLLPGWPESWIAWRKVLPLLVGAGRSVVVLDLEVSARATSRLEVTISILPHATCIVSLKRPTSRPREESTSSPMTSGRGSRTPTPRIIQPT
jgi:hypothetical protein